MSDTVPTPPETLAEHLRHALSDALRHLDREAEFVGDKRFAGVARAILRGQLGDTAPLARLADAEQERDFIRDRYDEDVEQKDDLSLVQSATREKCCTDCAFRKGSPEDEIGDREHLADVARGARSATFFCHVGMRRVVSYRHPDGRELPAGEGDYAPAMRDGKAYRADGGPADVCAGFAALRRAVQSAAPTEDAA